MTIEMPAFATTEEKLLQLTDTLESVKNILGDILDDLESGGRDVDSLAEAMEALDDAIDSIGDAVDEMEEEEIELDEAFDILENPEDDE